MSVAAITASCAACAPNRLAVQQLLLQQPFSCTPLRRSLALPVRSAPRLAVSAGPTDTTSSSTKLVITPPAGTVAAAYAKFVLRVCLEGSSKPADCTSVDCLPANAACLVDKLVAGTAYDITAVAVKGSDTGLPSNTTNFIAPFRHAGGGCGALQPLRQGICLTSQPPTLPHSARLTSTHGSALPCPCSAPTLVVNDTTPTSAVVAVAAPSGTTFDKFVLTYCAAGTIKDCPTTECAVANAAACTIAGLKPNTVYSVSAIGVKGRARSLPSTVELVAKYPYVLAGPGQ